MTDASFGISFKRGCYYYVMLSLSYDIQDRRKQQKKTEKFKLRNIVLDDVYGNQCTDVQETEMSS